MNIDIDSGLIDNQNRQYQSRTHQTSPAEAADDPVLYSSDHPEQNPESLSEQSLLTSASSSGSEIIHDRGLWEWLTGSHHRTMFHPMAGLWVLGIDWMLFSGNAVSLGFLTLLFMIIGFGLGGVGVAFCQHHYAQEDLTKSLLKGLFSGIVVGAPMPIAGTFVGAIIMGMSGLSAIADKLPFSK